MPSAHIDRFALLSNQIAAWTTARKLHDLLQDAAMFLAHYFNAEVVALGMVGDTHINFKSWVLPEGIHPQVSATRVLLQAPSVASHVALTGEIVRFDDAGSNLHHIALFEGMAVRSVIVAPLRAGDKVVGVMDLQSGVPGHFGRQDEELLGSIGAYLGFCIEHTRMTERFQDDIIQTVTALSAIVEAKDHYCQGTSEKIRDLSSRVAVRLGVPAERIQTLAYACILHDVGKLVLPEALLHKRGPLTQAEFETMQTHTQLGREMLSKIDFLADAGSIVVQHHEHYDGTGYPHGLEGDEISIEAGILAVVDAFFAITSQRPYREALSIDDACKELLRQAGKQFDPKVVEVLLSVLSAAR